MIQLQKQDQFKRKIKDYGIRKRKEKFLDQKFHQMVDNQSAMLNADMTGKAKQKEIANEETFQTSRKRIQKDCW